MRKFTTLHIPKESDSKDLPCLHLPFDLRRKSRQIVRLENGEEVGLMLPPGTALSDGDILQSEDGSEIRIAAANEQLMVVTAPDRLLLLRAAYHLGNRHTVVQIEAERLLLLRDPVLKEMLLGLGAQITDTTEPFNPELGAYGGGHKHGHDETFAEDQAMAHRVFHEHAADTHTTPSHQH